MSYDKDKMVSELNSLADKINSVSKTKGKKTIPEMTQALEGVTKPEGKIAITDTEIKDVSSYAQAQVVDDNLIAENIKKDISILGVTGTLESGSEEDSDKQWLEKTLTGEYSNDNITKIGFGAFSYQDELTKVTLNNVGNMGNNSCGNMFRSCAKLKEVNLPNFNIGVMNSISSDMFNACPELEKINLPSLQHGLNYMFYNLPKLKVLNLPELIDTREGYVFCQLGIKKIELPKFYYNNYSNTFQSCNKLITLILGSAEAQRLWIFQNNFIYSCGMLKNLVIKQKSIPRMDKSNSISLSGRFTGTKGQYNLFSKKDGAIYIDDDYLEGAKTATNWSAYADYMKPLSEYVDEEPSPIITLNATYSIYDKGVQVSLNGTDYVNLSSTINNIDEEQIYIANNSTTIATIKVGTTNGGSDLGTLAQGESINLTFTDDTTIYLS